MKYLISFNENMDLAKSIISKKMAAFDKLKGLLSSNMGYIGTFTKFLFDKNIPYEDLERLYNELVYLKKKDKSFDISGLEYEDLIDKIISQKNNIDVQALINQFPSDQKKMAKDLIQNDHFNLFLQLTKKDNLDAFLKKISRYKDENSLISAIKIFGKKSINNKEDILNFIKGSENTKVIVDSGDLMIVYVGSFNDIKSLASDTSWCILSEYMWRKYTIGRYQYILYNFDKDEFDPQFKIGMTLTKDGTIHAAHDILDNQASNEVREILSKTDLKLSGLIATTMEKLGRKPIAKISIDRINSRTSVANLEALVDDTPIKDIPKLISKFMDCFIFTKGYIQDVTDSRKKQFYRMFDKYFVDKTIVTIDDLSKIDKRLPNLIKKMGAYYKIISRKFIDKESPSFSKDNQNIIPEALNIWSDDEIVNNISAWQLLYGIKGWDKNILESISDKLHSIKKKNNPQKEEFIACLVGIDLYLGKEVPKSDIDKVNNSYLSNYWNVFNLPFELQSISSIHHMPGKWMNLVIKKDYVLNLPLRYNSAIIPDIIGHLKGFKIEFKGSKSTINGYLKTRDDLKNRDENSKLFFSVLDKFTKKSKKGDSVESDDGSIKITLD